MTALSRWLTCDKHFRVLAGTSVRAHFDVVLRADVKHRVVQKFPGLRTNGENADMDDLPVCIVDVIEPSDTEHSQEHI